jgi:hypothetical protein
LPKVLATKIPHNKAKKIFWSNCQTGNKTIKCFIIAVLLIIVTGHRNPFLGPNQPNRTAQFAPLKKLIFTRITFVLKQRRSSKISLFA